MATEKASFEVELKDDVTPGARKAQGSLARLQAMMERFGSGAISKGVGQLGQLAKTGMAVGATMAGAIAGGIAVMTTSMVDFNQRSMKAFGLIAQQGEAPEKLFQRSIDLAKQFGLDIKDVTQAATRFRAFGFDQAQAETLIKMGADMRALGSTTDEVNRAFLAFSQIKSAGRLQGDELNQLAEAGIPVSKVYEALAKNLGKTVPEIIKLKEAGGVDSGMALNAIGQALLQTVKRSEFGQAGQEAADATLSGFGGQLRAGFQDLFRRAAVQAEGPIVAALRPIGEKLGKLMEDPKTAAGVAGAVTAIADAIIVATPLVEKFVGAFAAGAGQTWDAVLASLRPIFAMLGGQGDNGIRVIETIGKALGAVVAIGGGAIIVLGGLASVTLSLFNGMATFVQGLWTTVVDILGSIVAPFVMAFDNVKAVLDSAGMTIWEKGVAIGTAVIKGVLVGMASLASAPFRAVVGYAQSWVAGAKGALGIASPSQVFADIGRNMALGTQVGINSEMPAVETAVQGLARTPVAAANDTSAAAGGGSSPVVNLHVAAGPGADQEDAERMGSYLHPIIRRIVRGEYESLQLEAAG